MRGLPLPASSTLPPAGTPTRSLSAGMRRGQLVQPIQPLMECRPVPTMAVSLENLACQPATMIFDHIEKLKRQLTDKYVVADVSRPELQRFRGLTGMVKTVNMSGRALVEFDGYNNIGWYDIDPSFLRVVDAPAPKPVEAKKDKATASKAESPKVPPAAAKPVGERKTPAPAAKAAAPTAGKSVAEILAAARKPAPAAAAPAVAAEAPPAPAKKAAPGGKGMSMAEILAAARGKGAAPAAPAAKAEAAPAPAKPAPAPKPTPAEKPTAAAPAKVAPGGKGMSMAEILAAARGKGGTAPAVISAPAPQPVQESPPAAEEPAAAEPEAEAPVAAPAASAGASGRSEEHTSELQSLR